MASVSKDNAGSLAVLNKTILELGLRSHESDKSFLDNALQALASGLAADFAGVMRNIDGRWSTVASVGNASLASGELTAAFLADALDSESPVKNEGWIAASVDRRAAAGEVLIVHAADMAQAERMRGSVEQVLPSFAQAAGSVRSAGREHRRRRRLEALLTISGQWNQTQEMEPLLVQMAEAATKMLAADRASIFLWDKPNKLLIGRPALGVEGNELRIPDDKGVVGEVIRMKQPRRVDLRFGQEQIARDVDAKLGYKTRTLICVPLVSRRGEILGAFEVINKLEGDFTEEDETALTEFAAHAATALENTQERARLMQSRRHLADEAASGVQIVGESPAIEALRSTTGRVADTELAVLILGENGTGKEVVARTIHYLSPRRDQPFIAVNCAAITETLLESELFGHEKGAFTDAHEARPGKFELADGGTLFLDEIGDLSLGGQAKLLRVLEEKVVVRVGGSKSIHTDARVIAATNQNLAEMVRAKKFRQDLFFRLNVVSINLPALRDRPGDITLLAEHFLHDFAKKARRKLPALSAAAKKRLEAHAWPGNIRELRNAMERLAYLCSSDRIEPEDLAFILAAAGEVAPPVPDDLSLAEATDEFQKTYIKRSIDRTGGNMSEAAERLGLHRSNLYRKMRQLGMPT
ncbi:MAG: sigma-54-dependent Fis family transcriptional regulator [Planctomycetia bacterium]|nr:sigma-54-dependent Fis family transcriptional regulator [Planctomycetia bacterium]